MAIPITIPRLGWNMTEGVFVGWLKPDGASVSVGEALFKLESDKATEDIECLDAGILRIAPNASRQGETIAVGTVIGYLIQAGETVSFESQTGAPVQVQTAETTRSTALPASPSVRQLARSRGVDLGAVTGTGKRGRIMAEDVLRLDRPAARSIPDSAGGPTISPRARRIARELGFDWSNLRGSGRTGRIRERDIRAASAKMPAMSSPNIHPPGSSIAISSIRRTIAERMLASQRSTAPVTLTTTLSATNLVNLRGQFKAAVHAGDDAVPSYTDFLVKLLAFALQKHSLLNARWSDDQITICSNIDIGIAVDTEAGLMVPVVRDVPALGLKQLAGRTRDLIERARRRKLTKEELQGGTFTITNLGAFGIDAFTPIINAPECAILGVGRIQRMPVVVGDQIVARDRLTLSLTFDHRIVDGAPAARFLQTLSGLIENPGPSLMA